MTKFFTLDFIQDKQYQYDPMLWAYSIGQECKICKTKIIHNQCISPCSCYRYCHEKCLVQELNNINLNKESSVYRCKTCKKALGIIFQQKIIKSCRISKINIFLLILSLISLPLCIYSAALYKEYPIVLGFYSFLITFVISILAFSIISSCVSRQFTVLNVTSTHLGLMISAFVDLQKQIEEQTTHTQMFR